MSDESTVSSSPPSTANSTGSLEASSGKGETATEGESDYPDTSDFPEIPDSPYIPDNSYIPDTSDIPELPDIDTHPSAYSLESTTATALTAATLGGNPSHATTQIPEGKDIEPTRIQTLAELHRRLSEVPPEQLVVLYFQSAGMTSKLVGPALAGLRDTFDLEVIKLDLNAHQEISTAYSINQTPTFVFIKNSEKLDQFSGADVKKLKSVINPLTISK